MISSKIVPSCCNQEATWVDNVPTKEYWYCKSCKREVIAPLTFEVKNVDKEKTHEYTLGNFLIFSGVIVDQSQTINKKHSISEY